MDEMMATKVYLPRLMMKLIGIFPPYIQSHCNPVAITTYMKKLGNSSFLSFYRGNQIFGIYGRTNENEDIHFHPYIKIKYFCAIIRISHRTFAEDLFHSSGYPTIISFFSIHTGVQIKNMSLLGNK